MVVLNPCTLPSPLAYHDDAPTTITPSLTYTDEPYRGEFDIPLRVVSSELGRLQYCPSTYIPVLSLDSVFEGR